MVFFLHQVRMLKWHLENILFKNMLIIMVHLVIWKNCASKEHLVEKNICVLILRKIIAQIRASLLLIWTIIPLVVIKIFALFAKIQQEWHHFKSVHKWKRKINFAGKDTSTCECIPMNPSWGHLWPPFLKIWSFSTFSQGRKPTKSFIKDALVKPSRATSFGIEQTTVMFSNTKPRSFHSQFLH